MKKIRKIFNNMLIMVIHFKCLKNELMWKSIEETIKKKLCRQSKSQHTKTTTATAT